MESSNQKSHRKTKAGRGSKEKKKLENQKAKGTATKKHNVRAFGVANTVRTKRNMQRNLDKTHQKEYAPSENDRRVSGEGWSEDWAGWEGLVGAMHFTAVASHLPSAVSPTIP